MPVTHVLPSAARTTLQAVEVDVPFGVDSVMFEIDVTVDPAAASVTPTINGVSASGAKYALLAGAAINAVGVTTLSVGPGLPATANVSANGLLPSKLSFDMAVADADSITYSVTAYFV